MFVQDNVLIVPAASYAQFGQSVSFDISGNTCVIGAPGENAVYLYKRIAPAQWIQSKIITHPKKSVLSNGEFGNSVSLSNAADLILIGK
jgi:hypothetical protein